MDEENGEDDKKTESFGFRTKDDATLRNLEFIVVGIWERIN